MAKVIVTICDKEGPDNIGIDIEFEPAIKTDEITPAQDFVEQMLSGMGVKIEEAIFTRAN